MADLDFSSEESIGKILGNACEKASPPSEYRARLLKDIMRVASVKEAPRPLWQMTDWAIIAAAIILAIIAYGIWLSYYITLD